MPKFTVNLYATTTVCAVVDIEATSWDDAKKRAEVFADDGVDDKGHGLMWEESSGLERSAIVTEVYLLDEDGNTIEEGSEHDDLTAKRINVTLGAYEGDAFPDADALFEAYVLAELVRQHPKAEISVSTAQGGTRVFIDGEPDQSLAQEIGADWWTAFCETQPLEES